MASIAKSGAFLQQCFSVHPRCLEVKRCQPATVLLQCTSCRFVHRIAVERIETRASHVDAVAERDEPPGGDRLTQCVDQHRHDLAIRAMDVLEDFVGLRCAACRRLFDLRATAFETEQRG